MRILLKKARIVAPGQPLHGMSQDLLIDEGIIVRISENLNTAADQVIEQDDLHVSPGWMDIFTHLCDPGYEFKEDLESGARSAAAGGFTDVMVLPNTDPPLESKAQIEYIINKSLPLPVNIHPIGAVSRELAGKSLAEMYEMHQSGALAFSDGLHPVQSSGLLLKALQYVKAFGGILIQVPEDTGISHHGFMHEGLWSTRLGVQGKPSIAEEIFIKRDLELLRYTKSRLHFTGISIGKSIDLIRQAKESGLDISCSVTPYHLMLTDEELQHYDSNLKVNPPLREQEDVSMLREAVKEGVIDCFATHHMPQDRDSKQKEFEYAEEGMIGMESCFGLLGRALPDVSIEQKIRLLAMNPRRIFGLPVPEITEGAVANLTIFNPVAEWIFKEKTIRSKSKNSAFLDKNLKGKVIGIINKKRFFQS